MAQAGAGTGITVDLAGRDPADHAGRWVALDIRTHEVVLVADSPEELDDQIRAAGLVADVATAPRPAGGRTTLRRSLGRRPAPAWTRWPVGGHHTGARVQTFINRKLSSTL